MSGRKITTAHSIMNNVRWLLDAFHIVRLALGASDDGSKNGNNVRPALAIMEATIRLLRINARPSCFFRAKNATNIGSPSANMNGTMVAGSRA